MRDIVINGEVEWEGRKFGHINNDTDFSTGVIALERYFTVLPISPANYRKAHPTQASISLKMKRGKVPKLIITFCDDWGTRNELTIPMKIEYRGWLSEQFNKCVEAGLMKSYDPMFIDVIN